MSQYYLTTEYRNNFENKPGGIRETPLIDKIDFINKQTYQTKGDLPHLDRAYDFKNHLLSKNA